MSAAEKPTVVLGDGNSFAIVGECMNAARGAGWDEAAIKAFTDEAMSGDYDHLLQVVLDRFRVELQVSASTRIRPVVVDLDEPSW